MTLIKILKIGGVGVLSLTLGFGIFLIKSMYEHGHLTEWSEVAKKEGIEQLRKELPHCTYQELEIEYWRRLHREINELRLEIEHSYNKIQWWKDQYKNLRNSNNTL